MAVDGRFRRMSGSVSVSTKALRELPLPAAEEVGGSLGRASEATMMRLMPHTLHRPVHPQRRR